MPIKSPTPPAHHMLALSDSSKDCDCCASLISKITDNHWNKLYKCDMNIIIATAGFSQPSIWLMLEWGGCRPVSTLLPLSFSSEPVGPTDTVAGEGCCCCWLESLASSSLSRALACSRVSWRSEGGEGGWRERSMDKYILYIFTHTTAVHCFVCLLVSCT